MPLTAVQPRHAVIIRGDELYLMFSLGSDFTWPSGDREGNTLWSHDPIKLAERYKNRTKLSAYVQRTVRL